MSVEQNDGMLPTFIGLKDARLLTMQSSILRHNINKTVPFTLALTK